jgi:hypothetical protein
MEVAYQRDSITVLGQDRDAQLFVETYGREVTKLLLEVRSVDGSRLIESTELKMVAQQEGELISYFALKDLIEKDVPYSLTFCMTLEDGTTLYYYTQAIWSDALHVQEKMDYVLDFHNKLYDREAARELIKYMETNASLEDNKSFHKVNIYSSFQQFTWGDLRVQEVVAPKVFLTEIAEQTASFLLDYVVSTTSDEGNITYYMVQEHFRVRYTKDRMYLLGYERTMTQIPDVNQMYANDKILLGIASDEVPMMESSNGNIVVFEAADRLFSYDVKTNKLVLLFGFYNEDHADVRNLFGRIKTKILSVDTDGNVEFIIYGYMSRGRHEGEVGLQLMQYNSSLNTVEEILYIPYAKGAAVLEAELAHLLYRNPDGKLYFEMDHIIYEVDSEEKVCKALVRMAQDEELLVADSHKVVVWTPEGADTELYIRDFANKEAAKVAVAEDESMFPLGLIGDDVIFGVAKKTDIKVESNGETFAPMYKVCIADATGAILKEYSQQGIYIESCSVEGNQITLQRLKLSSRGKFQATTPDQITNNTEEVVGKNTVAPTDIDRYKHYVQIKLKSKIDKKTIQVLNPKEVVFEGVRELTIPDMREKDGYYVYGAYGIEGIYLSPANAINLAYEKSAVVVDEQGNRLWQRGNRSTVNQIMAIKAPEKVKKELGLAKCLDTIFALEGLMRDSAYLLEQSQTAEEVLRENLTDALVLNLTGCSLDSVLYYVNLDIPVLALLEDGQAVLITGYNENQIVIMDPVKGTLSKKGMSDSAEWFTENGNCFITYVRGK